METALRQATKKRVRSSVAASCYDGGPHLAHTDTGEFLARMAVAAQTRANRTLVKRPRHRYNRHTGTVSTCHRCIWPPRRSHPNRTGPAPFRARRHTRRTSRSDNRVQPPYFNIFRRRSCCAATDATMRELTPSVPRCHRDTAATPLNLRARSCSVSTPLATPRRHRDSSPPVIRSFPAPTVA